MKKFVHILLWKLLSITYKCWPDTLWLKIIYQSRMHRKLNLKHPQLFSEKLAWLKLHDRKSVYSQMVDKYEAKEYVASLLGQNFIIPNYGVWNRFDDIDFDQLPNQFVLKCTHDSGGLVICRDKVLFNKEAARQKLEFSLRHNFWWWTREWSYKNVPPRIIAEKYVEDETAKQGLGLTDYKFYCFNGEPRFLYISTGLENHTTARISFITMDWKMAPFRRQDFLPYDQLPPRPSKFDEMVTVARKLSSGMFFLRVDLYQIDEQVYFSELTFYPCGGMMPFAPKEWDWKIGQLLQLPID